MQEKKLNIWNIDLTRLEKVKVFGNIQISSLLPKSKFQDEIQEIWDDF